MTELVETIEGRLEYLLSQYPPDRSFIRLQEQKLAIAKQILARERAHAAAPAG